ncbi:MAG TPA: pilus assembly protein PilP [Syntrophales bacterium]|nr:pilus assembly protein PilP [Syntrophales bacterium]HOH73781.1 pilus assembly protein PilP [Syntrophales bacterium]HPN07955.1 pilus assembly protein PilP [Syntrophales bacterium]HPX82543.1 pilus assembly protein PilP [Syntrophales bacterium]HQB14187.1 pilus assembly protein PilP [Syntrophales bacterium]
MTRKSEMIAVLIMAGFIFSAGPAGAQTGGATASPPRGAAYPPDARPPVAAESSLIFRYDPKGKPDPFKPFLEAELALRKLKELEKRRLQKKLPLSPLQRAPIDQFRLVGVGGVPKSRTALVQDQAGKYYTLNIGVPIGTKNGRVVKILADRVIIDEPVAGVDKKGKRGVKQIEMKLFRINDEGKP